MRLPPPQLESLGYLYGTSLDVIHALGDSCTPDEAVEIERLFALGLPPVTSEESLSVMFGYNPGFIWSLTRRTVRHYREFRIPKGTRFRSIQAPHVGLKAIQKWLSYHFQKAWYPHRAVYGFVPGRSHIDAASVHLNARWVYSVDIEDFFPSVLDGRVREALIRLGYRTEKSLYVLSRLVCLGARLAQGAPTSPVISNIVLNDLDQMLSDVATFHSATFTRYADDIVFSGQEEFPQELPDMVKDLLIRDGWRLAAHKEELSQLPKRLKVHGLLVHGGRVRLTKGYRNRIRAYRHLMARDKIRPNDTAKVAGHLAYARQIDQFEE